MLDYTKIKLTLLTINRWYEVGKYDIPAVINFITSFRNKLVHYIGHSLGATYFCVAAIERPDIGRKIKSFIGLGPSVYNNHARAIPLQIFNFIQEPLRVS